MSGKREGQWIESPEDKGFRFVGYSDELAGHIRHTGYYCDGFQDRTLRGVVYQLPGKDGKARYVYGYTSSDDTYKGKINGAFLLLRDVTEGDGTEEDTQTKRDVAVWGDSLAERAAEEERDYNAAWQSGSAFAQEGETLALLKADRASLLRQLERVREDIRDVQTKRAKLANGEYLNDSDAGWYTGNKQHRAAFLEGASLKRKPSQAKW